MHSGGQGSHQDRRPPAPRGAYHGRPSTVATGVVEGVALAVAEVVETAPVYGYLKICQQGVITKLCRISNLEHSFSISKLKKN